jgi:hypothetical protein
MRLRPEKIRDLADEIVGLLKSHPKIRIQTSDSDLRVVIGSVIRDNLEEEDEIEAEVDELMAQHRREIESQGLDPHALRMKFKREIAKRRGFVL